jgi:hypothetical protein
MFSERYDASAPGVVIINETLARRLWSNGDPLTDRLLVGRILDPAYNKDPVRQIVGIVADVRDVALNRPPRPIMYVPAAQLPDGVKALSLPLLPVAWAIRTHGHSAMLRDAIQNELRAASGGLPVARIRGLEQVADESTARTRNEHLYDDVLRCHGFCCSPRSASMDYWLLRSSSAGVRSESGWRWEIRQVWYAGW